MHEKKGDRFGLGTEVCRLANTWITSTSSCLYILTILYFSVHKHFRNFGGLVEDRLRTNRNFWAMNGSHIDFYVSISNSKWLGQHLALVMKSALRWVRMTHPFRYKILSLRSWQLDVQLIIGSLEQPNCKSSSTNCAELAWWSQRHLVFP